MEIIWTASAAEDYLRTETNRPHEFAAALDGALSLLRSFPEMGAKVEAAPNIRRILVGRDRHYGLFYGHTAQRISVVALINLRQNPDSIRRILKERQPGT